MNTLKHISPLLMVFFLSIFVVNCERVDPEMEQVVEPNTEFNASPLKSEMIFPNTKIEWLMEVISTIEEMVEKGILSQGNANALIVKVKNAIKSIEKGNTNAVSGQLSAFIYHVEDFVEEGILRPVDIVVFLELINNGPGNTFTDVRDSKSYAIVQIGDQVWMAENLAYLPSVSPYNFSSQVDPYYYVYEYNGTSVAEAKATNNYNTYGVLYNWPAAVAACPEGWHLASDAEWKQLEMYIGMSHSEADEIGSRGTNEGSKLKSTSGWINNGNGTNESGFSALPGGANWIPFNSIGIAGYWWCGIEFDNNSAWHRNLKYYQSDVDRYYSNKYAGMSVRCIRD